MSYHLEFIYLDDDREEHGGQVASSSGWHDFCKGVRDSRGEDVHDDELLKLCDDGYSEDVTSLIDAIESYKSDVVERQSVADGLLDQLLAHDDADAVIVTDGATDEDEEDGDPEQFDEMSDYLARLREVVGKGQEAAKRRVQDLADSIDSMNVGRGSYPDLGDMVARQVEALAPLLGHDLTADALPSSVRGVLEVLSRLSGPQENVYGGVALRPDTKHWRAALASPETEEHPSAEVVLPAIEASADALREAPVVAGRDYLETARAVRDGAFAVTGKLTEAAVQDVRDQVVKAVSEGTTLDDFRAALKERLESEGSPLSPARLENVFRTNVLAAYSQGKWDAVTKDPVVTDAFPYARYFATHDGRVRPEHLAMETAGLDGTNVYRTDDPTFQKFRPPWSYQCRCRWSPCTVEQAAAKGVKEAKAWLDRAKEMAKDLGGHHAQYLSQVAPAASEHVTAPPFEPPEGFVKE